MLFAVTDDGTLLVLGDLDHARRQVETYEAESGDVVFYDESGRPLDVIFPPCEHPKLLGMVIDNTAGPFELIAAKAKRPNLLDSLGSILSLEPNPYFQSLSGVRDHLASA